MKGLMGLIRRPRPSSMARGKITWKEGDKDKDAVRMEYDSINVLVSSLIRMSGKTGTHVNVVMGPCKSVLVTLSSVAHKLVAGQWLEGGSDQGFP